MTHWFEGWAALAIIGSLGDRIIINVSSILRRTRYSLPTLGYRWGRLEAKCGSLLCAEDLHEVCNAGDGGRKEVENAENSPEPPLRTLHTHRHTDCAYR